MKSLSRIGLLASLLLTGVAHVHAAEFFVSPTGNDGHPGTLEKPFATVQRAQDAVTPGDTVWHSRTDRNSAPVLERFPCTPPASTRVEPERNDSDV